MDVAQVRAYLGIITNDTDDQLQVLLDGTLAFFWSMIDGDLTANDITEYYNGGGEQHIFLKKYPVISVASVKENTGSHRIPIRTDIDDNTYIIQEDKGMITFPNGSVPRGFKNIQIVYRAGYETLPLDIELAVLDTIAISWRRKGSEGKNSERIDDYSISWDRNDLSEKTTKILERYKKYNV